MSFDDDETTEARRIVRDPADALAFLRRYEREFWLHADRAAPNGCWAWSGYFHAAGYGLFNIPKQFRILAHRAAWMLINGAITGEQHVLHRCDNPPCINPAHLFLGDQSLNVADMVAKGRQSRGAAKSAAIALGIQKIREQDPERYSRRFAHCIGASNPVAKLTDDDVRLIRNSEGTSLQIAPIFGVSSSIIRDIRARKRWTHVSD